MKFLIIVITLVAFSLGEGRKDLEAELLGVAPKIIRATDNSKTATASIKVPGGLPAPIVGFSYFGKSVETKNGPQNWVVSIKQPLPWPSKLTLQRDIAEIKSRGVLVANTVVSLDVLLSFRKLWAQYYFLDKSIKINNEILSLTKSWLERSRSGYETGKIPYSSLIKMENRVALLGDQITSNELYKSQVLSQINELFGKAVNPTISTELEPLHFDTSVSNIENHPLVTSISEYESAQEVSIKQQKSRFAPDFGVGFNYIGIGETDNVNINSGIDAWSVGASLSLPIWAGSAKSGVETAKSQLAELGSKKRVIKEQLIRQRDVSLIKRRDAIKSIRLYNDKLIPQMRQIISVQEREYESETISFIDLFDSYEQLLKLELAKEKSETDRFIAEAMLSWLTVESIKKDSNEFKE